MFQGETSHFALPTIQALGKLSEAHDIKSLTPVQTANLAYRSSLLYTIPKETLQRLQEIFKPVKQTYETRKARGEKFFSMEPYKECARIMFEDHGKDSQTVFTVGKAFLEPYLNKREDIIHWYYKDHFGEFNGEFWDSIREKIKQRTEQEETKTPEQRLAQEAKDMMVLGRFDKDPNSKIDPHTYESAENMAYLDRAMNTYAAMRSMQETDETLPGSKVKVAALNQEQLIALAREFADEPADKPPAAKPPQPSSTVKVSR